MSGPAAKQAYTREEARRLVGISERQLKSWEDQKLVAHHSVFTFLELLALRTLAKLRSDPKFDEVRDYLEDTASGFGKLTAVRHSAVMSETPPRWARPSVPLGTHPPAWPQ